MQRLLALFALLCLSSCATPIAADYDNTYFLNGVDRQDGMSATISHQHAYLRVAGEALPLTSCVDLHYPACFSSSYMVFSYPDDTRNTWRVNGIEFTKIGVGPVFDMGVNERVEIIESIQSYGTFSFYYSKGSGLVGWDLLYKTQDGGMERSRYFRNRFNRSRPQSNNSFKPRPLRGSA